MNTKVLIALVLLLGIGWWLADTNPTVKTYKQYQEKLIQQGILKLKSSKKSSVLKQLVTNKNSLFLKSVLEAKTTHQNFYFATLFETQVFSTRLRVLGIGGNFYPLDDPDKVMKSFEQKVISPQ